MGSRWQNTNYSPTEESEGTQDILALLVNSSLRVVTFSKTNLDVTVSALPALSEPGRFFFNTNASFYVKLWSNLTYNLSFYGSWDTRPPATYTPATTASAPDWDGASATAGRRSSIGAPTLAPFRARRVATIQHSLVRDNEHACVSAGHLRCGTLGLVGVPLWPHPSCRRARRPTSST